MVAPASLTLFLNKIIIRLFYKVKVVGTENVPKEGGALIVSNHLSWADASLLLYTFKRPIRFLIFRDIHNQKLVNFFTAGIDCIPISFDDSPKKIMRALVDAKKAVENGELVCIFPEGKISRNGQLLPFQKGLRKLEGLPTIPVSLAGLAGSFLTPPLGAKGKRKLFGKAVVAVGKRCETNNIREDVSLLGRTSFEHLFDKQATLGSEIIKHLRKGLLYNFFEDSLGTKLKGISILVGALHLSKNIPGRFATLLPTSCASVLCTVASLMKDQEIINLNYTSDPAHCIELGSIETVVTSRKFLEKTGLMLNCNVVYIEDLLAKRPSISTFWASVFSKLYFQNKTAAIIFTSGSTSKPKGVKLSHLNLLSNVEGISTAYNILPSFKMLGVLPAFHSFGLTGNILLPIFTGMKAVLHHNPLEAKSISKLLRNARPNVLLLTPSFLKFWKKSVKELDLSSIEYLICGAEPLPISLIEETEVNLLQGYGCTETSPVISVSTAEDDPLSCGKPIPGTVVQIREEGRVFVSGTNVMQGYLGKEEVGEWYDTGDVGKIDENGEVYITGRVARFSKIAGEMVSHQALEDAIDGDVVVVSLPDDAKGEKLFCLHTDELDLGAVKAKMKQAKLPNLMLPSLIKVEEIPKTGTGKLDLGKAKEIAKQASF